MKNAIIFLIFVSCLRHINGQKHDFIFQEVFTSDSIRTVEMWQKERFHEKNIKLIATNRLFNNLNHNAWQCEEFTITYKDVPIEHGIIRTHKRDGLI